MTEDQIPSARANARDAIAAFEAVGIYAKAQPPVIAASDRRRASPTLLARPPRLPGRLPRIRLSAGHAPGRAGGPARAGVMTGPAKTRSSRKETR